MQRFLLIAAVVLVGSGLVAGSLAWVLTGPPAAPEASPAERLYTAHCADCHGADGRGSWRATLLMVHPGDFTDGSLARQSDQYLFDVVKHGGSPIGRPGMPGFEANLGDDDIRLLIDYMRGLAARRLSPPGRS